jgi:hypothetical protein
MRGRAKGESAMGTTPCTPVFWIVCDEDSCHASSWSIYADYSERVVDSDVPFELPLDCNIPGWPGAGRHRAHAATAASAGSEIRS